MIIIHTYTHERVRVTYQTGHHFEDQIAQTPPVHFLSVWLLLDNLRRWGKIKMNVSYLTAPKLDEVIKKFQNIH